MMPGSLDLMQLRDAFDQSFAEPADVVQTGMSRFLAFRAHGDPYALRLDQVAGVTDGTKITELPSAVPSLRGLIGNRGVLVAVYAIAPLLGYVDSAELARWVVLCRGEAPFGLGLSELEGYLQTENRFVTSTDPDQAMAHVNGVIETGDGTARRIIDVGSLLKAITRAAATSGRAGDTHVDIR